MKKIVLTTFAVALILTGCQQIKESAVSVRKSGENVVNGVAQEAANAKKQLDETKAKLDEKAQQVQDAAKKVQDAKDAVNKITQ